jgi:hypothetical protein
VTATKRPGPAVAVAAALIVLVLAAVGVEALMSTRASGPGAGGYAVVIVRDDDVLARYTLEDLEAFEQVTIQADGDEQCGPRLLDVLEDAGVDEFDRLSIAGMGIRDDGELALVRSEVTADVVLDISRRGTVKVVSPDMTWEDRVRDVTEIVVE